MTNKISIVELESKQEFAHFEGVQLKHASSNFQFLVFDSNLTSIHAAWSWPHLKGIANTGLLVSVHHCYDRSANLEVFDVSLRGQEKKIFSFEEVVGSRINLIS